jgi:hypothetical protein
MIKKRYPPLTFDENKKDYEFEEIPGLKEAGWTLKTYEQARYFNYFSFNHIY